MFMLTSEQTGLPTDALVALRREKLLAEGRHDAFIFVFECQCNAQRLRQQIRETEETIANPPEHLKGPMKPNASPRVYKDGYLAGLKDALRIVEQADGSAARTAALAPARAPALAIAEGRSQYDVTAEPASAAPSEPSPPTTSPTTDD
jgi:hypothetical protein